MVCLDPLLRPWAKRSTSVCSDVGLADDLDEGPLGAPARLEQPVGEVATLPQLRDGQIDRAGPGVPGPGPVAVSTVSPIFRALPVRSPADRIDFLAHQPLTEELYHLWQQVCVGFFHLLAKPGETVHGGVDHRAPPPRVPTDLVEDDAVVFSFNDLQRVARTPRPRTLLSRDSVKSEPVLPDVRTPTVGLGPSEPP